MLRRWLLTSVRKFSTIPPPSPNAAAPAAVAATAGSSDPSSLSSSSSPSSPFSSPTSAPTSAPSTTSPVATTVVVAKEPLKPDPVVTPEGRFLHPLPATDPDRPFLNEFNQKFPDSITFAGTVERSTKVDTIYGLRPKSMEEMMKEADPPKVKVPVPTDPWVQEMILKLGGE